LWHQPLFAFARIYLPRVSTATYACLSVLTFALAFFSWRFVEQPLRDRARFSRMQLFSVAARGVGAILALGLAGQIAAGSSQRIPAPASITAWSQDWHLRDDQCARESHPPIAHGRSCLFGTNAQPQIALIGDSHADAVAFRLSEELSRYGISLRTLTQPGCPPIVGIRNEMAGCEQHNQEVQRYLLENPQIETVILVARWITHLESKSFDNTEGGVERDQVVYNIPVGMGREFLSDPARVEVLGRVFRDSINALLRAGKRVVLVYPTPEVGWKVPDQMMQRARFASGKPEPVTTSYEVFRTRNAPAYAELDLLGDPANLMRVYPAELFCNSQVAGRCVAELGGKPLYWDDDHLNYSAGAKLLAAQIAGAMKKRGWTNP
jgi:hypothetical protein